jgi:formate hydrogenlyase subunit 4
VPELEFVPPFALSQLLETLLLVLAAPLLAGWVAQCRAWLGNRTGPGLL